MVVLDPLGRASWLTQIYGYLPIQDLHHPSRTDSEVVPAAPTHHVPPLNVGTLTTQPPKTPATSQSGTITPHIHTYTHTRGGNTIIIILKLQPYDVSEPLFPALRRSVFHSLPLGLEY